MKTKILFGIIIITGLFYSCKNIIFREVDCRDFQIKGEYYWFPLNLGDSVVFLDSSKNVRKKYTIVDKGISHITKYTSDTGCGCLDVSKMLLTSGNDSIWFNNELKYVEDNEGKYYEDIVFVINGEQSVFYETSKKHLDTYNIDSISFSDVECFECKSCQADFDVKKFYRVRNLGIISIEFVNGEIWINENLTKTNIITKESFNYLERTCG